MCNDSEQKYYVQDKNGNLSGPFPLDYARSRAKAWVINCPYRVVTIVATEVPEPPKVSRVVTRKDGAGFRFHDKELWYTSGPGSGWIRAFTGVETTAPEDAVELAMRRGDYAFVRDFAALCEEVLGGGK